jgi:hypothetical protein
MQKLALARSSMHFERVEGGPYINIVAQFYHLLLYMLAIWLTIDDMTISYSQHLTIIELALRVLATHDLWRRGNNQ